MKIIDAYDKFRHYINFIQPESVYDLENIDVSQIDKCLHGNLNRHYTDSLGQTLQIGDLVAFDKIGGSCKGISKGILLGFTDSCYRVARVYRDRHQQYFHCDQMQTPYQGSAILIKTNRKYL